MSIDADAWSLRYKYVFVTCEWASDVETDKETGKRRETGRDGAHESLKVPVGPS